MRFDDGYETEDRCVHKISAAEGCPRCDGPRDEEPFLTLCSWCPQTAHVTRVLSWCGIYASHGLCRRHELEHFPEEKCDARAAA
jgi:hypothetical protein